MITGKIIKERKKGRRYVSAKDRGLREVISPGDTDSGMAECNWIKRLERNGQRS
ncbi:MAG: hypothetical protein ACK5H4_08630 [Lacrimispora sphenoides]